MRILAVVLAILAVVALFWLVGEQHYQGCVSAAVASTAPIEVEKGTGNPFAIAEGKVATGDERRAAVAGCSRLPF